MKHSVSKTQDIPPALAAMIFLGLAFALAAMKSEAPLAESFQQLDRIFEDWGAGVALMLLGLIGNLAAADIWAKKYWSYRRQGARLRDLTGDLKLSRFEGLKILGAVLLRSACMTLSLGCMLPLVTKILNVALPMAPFGVWYWCCVSNVGLFFVICLRVLANSGLSKPKTGRTELLAPELSVNEITLGTSGGGEEPETWVSMSKKALCGNVLVTGSIGSGKTQGTILPYFEQILKTFDPPPAVLAIDPKGTFIPEALEIARKQGREADVLRLSLEGSVTFNPIYVPNVLRHGRFMDTAQMIRAASVNFSGKGEADSPFWELSAFNLTKNALIYCAAVLGYYTLSDLYQTMLSSGLPKTVQDLEDALGSGRFQDEERHNIRQALRYFAFEFSAFDSKLQTGILATATSFLGMFQEFTAAQIFCPPEDGRTIESLDQVLAGGKILLFDISSPGLARAMGTFVKLHFQQAVLGRLLHAKDRERLALLIIDEYQDVVSSGQGSTLGDDRFLAKSREANAVTIAATQSLSSLENSIGKGVAAKELCQNFRTKIACHSSDLLTIRTFRELVGEADREKKSHSYSELSQETTKNYVTGGFDAEDANITESVSTSMQKESVVTGKDFLNLRSFEALALVYDGLATSFVKLYLKPYFLAGEVLSHADLCERLKPKPDKTENKLKVALAVLTALLLCWAVVPLQAAPNLCDVAEAPGFNLCTSFQVSSCTCPGIPPRPCALLSYYVPDTFVEVVGSSKSSLFNGLPGVSSQLSGLVQLPIPYGTEGNDFSAFHARTIPVPGVSALLHGMPCFGGAPETTCFGAMSEHLGPLWSTGAADLKQPNFLAWLHAPKACLGVGAARSALGGGEAGFSPGSNRCSTPMRVTPTFPPSLHSACNGWGVFYPRVGMYDGPSQTAAAVMIAARIKSLSSEVFQSASSSPDEKWQMIYPSRSQCFREGQNISFLESLYQANDLGRLRARPKDYLFATWKRVSCCTDFVNLPRAQAVLSGVQASCRGQGGIK